MRGKCMAALCEGTVGRKEGNSDWRTSPSRVPHCKVLTSLTYGSAAVNGLVRARNTFGASMSDSPEMSTFRVRVEGRVQAVGYRNFTIEQAKKHGLDGWVRNRANGDVEMLIHGEENAVNAFITACTQGPEGSRVASIDLEKAEP